MIGIAPEDIPVVRWVERPTDEDATRRLWAAAPEWMQEKYIYKGEDWFVWKEQWHYVPYEVLAKAFTHDELIRIWYDSFTSSRVDKHLEEHEELIWKVCHTIYCYGGFVRDYDRFIACFECLRRFHVGLPDFDVRVTHTYSINTASYSVHERSRTPGTSLYIDASFGLLLYYKGKHVMTIGFAFSNRGVQIAQVQLREKHGNRFLYKLPMPYLDFAIDLVQRAFPGDDIWLVTGESTVGAIRRAYGKNGTLPDLTAARIERFYDQGLRDYTRTDKTAWGPDDRRVFRRLARCVAAREGVMEAV